MSSPELALTSPALGIALRGSARLVRRVNRPAGRAFAPRSPPRASSGRRGRVARLVCGCERSPATDSSTPRSASWTDPHRGTGVPRAAEGSARCAPWRGRHRHALVLGIDQPGHADDTLAGIHRNCMHLYGRIAVASAQPRLRSHVTGSAPNTCRVKRTRVSIWLLGATTSEKWRPRQSPNAVRARSFRYRILPWDRARRPPPRCVPATNRCRRRVRPPHG